LGISSSESLRPDAIPLDVKVMLVGPRELYYLLSEYDPEFLELFKIEADFEDAIERTQESERDFSQMLATLASSRELRPVSAAAVALLVEESSRMAGDSRKLSTNIRAVFDLVQEAEFQTARRAGNVVSEVDIRSARESHARQRDRFRDHALEQVARGTILIDVAGRRVGQVNGLAALSLGDFMFGRPIRITATARIGEGRVIDIEREVELGGALHSKGVLILTNYLAQRYAKSYPLSLSASLVFEQSYVGVEGDSASLAELCALLSALAEVPVKQSIAVTGSVNQWGQVQAIGAVNEKVEGFHDTCLALGDGEHGVIIPKANVQHLMLREDVVESAAEGKLKVYAVATVDEAMEILTGLPAGTPDENGTSPPGTLNRLIEEQLVRFAVVAKRFGDLVEIGEETKGRRTTKKRRNRRR
jgi:predicted ATP-dependent protease